MKIVRLKGGLGNQMFQYAFGQVLGQDTKYELSWFDDCKKDKNATQRSYELDVYRCRPDIITTEELHKLKRNNKLLRLFGIKTKLPTITESPENIYNPKLFKIEKGIFNGYFQVSKYYDCIRSKLLEDFIPRGGVSEEYNNILKKIKETNSVSLHIRRGDYLKLQHIHGLCDDAYYKNAINYIAKMVKNPMFFIFSDDIAWAKENFKSGYLQVFVDMKKQDACSEIWLMKHCRHNIIANSSFSWWGAWLNENKGKIVAAPQNWFATGEKTDIIPSEWIRL